MEDSELINRAIEGDRKALENLLERYRDWIFNVALSFIAHREDAADITQEVLVKIMTKLSTFRQESDFKTWVYRIVKNHFLNMKRRRYEMYSMTFDSFARDLDEIPDEEFPGHKYEVEENLLVQEAKLGCMKAMLLCLDREQRLIFILGELFEFPDSVGSEVMEISKENFRIKLHRAKQQLYNFMNNKCGLINKKNPCRCARKTASYIKLGFVDPVSLHFQRDAIATIDSVSPDKVETYSNDVLSEYRTLFAQHPFLKPKEVQESIQTLLSSETIRKTFNLD
ncbi:RNA polymerase sigma factor [Chryseolinea sp. H1M3-3]|uniref:RNA polymerase sigma factor n=1 Tax=Chryseolinea sp. H1M3-3 TaxID=3034144 RepID=UPI0023ED23A6|nr:RNA polymerase sigma factor [Chryseolinea sp. H1M3-3]